MSNFYYSPLTVDFHENQFLDQVNLENRAKLQNPNQKQNSVPNNVVAFDRYAYTFNNPIRYNDPTGHCPWCAIPVVVVVIAGAPVEITVGMIALFAVGVAAVTIDVITPGFEDRVEARVAAAGEVWNSVTSLFAKGEYVPPGLSDAERNAYREAVHRYKDAYDLGATYEIDTRVLDKMAELLKKGLKPIDVVDKLPQPPEEDYEDDWDGE